jgi:hypothetical protein
MALVPKLEKFALQLAKSRETARNSIEIKEKNQGLLEKAKE